MSENTPFFSVVICTYQRYDFLPKAIDSVLKQEIDAECFDVWVMDNSPASPERAAMAQHYAQTPRLHYVLLDKAGLSNARNEGISQSSGSHVVFMDDDAVASPHWLTAYQDVFKSAQGKIGACGGKIEPYFEAPLPSWLSKDLYTVFSIIDWSDKICEFPTGVTPLGANIAFNRQALAACGGFNTSFGRSGSESASLMSGEESELFEKMQASAWKILYTPQASVTHHIPASRMTQAWVRRRLAWQAVTDQLKEMKTPEPLPMFADVVNYLRHVPPEQQAFMGLFWDTDNPELFKQQLNAIYMMTKILIAGGRYPDQIKP